MVGILAAALIAAFLTAWITPMVLRYAEKSSAVDQPGERRVNTRPMPRLGGVAIFLGFLIAAVLTVTLRQYSRAGQHTWNMQLVGVIVATTFMAIIGLIDDFRDLAAKWQALALITCGLILFKFGVRIEGVTNIFGGAGTASYN
ncbi:MAG: UDP-N-acetylmuramyl pentapeptide phosphotransferase/UDP-N-acetylglucosamine-phosphate transferase, partial [Chthonomonadales bacterium]|nr:UDP-N-acetylmuramyl pentapeptide phosphotransferase/UDP-N-acetylglucosamine-phosphate transferase [Chthonomonadales bacterium]